MTENQQDRIKFLESMVQEKEKMLIEKDMLLKQARDALMQIVDAKKASTRRAADMRKKIIELKKLTDDGLKVAMATSKHLADETPKPLRKFISEAKNYLYGHQEYFDKYK